MTAIGKICSSAQIFSACGKGMMGSVYIKMIFEGDIAPDAIFVFAWVDPEFVPR